MKNTILTLACLLMAPMAFGQTHSKRESQTTAAAEQSITVTGTTITNEGGSAASYQPFKTLIVNKDTPGRFVLNGPGHVLNKNGEVIRTAIKPGTHVSVYYANMGDSRMIERVVVD